MCNTECHVMNYLYVLYMNFVQNKIRKKKIKTKTFSNLRCQDLLPSAAVKPNYSAAKSSRILLLYDHYVIVQSLENVIFLLEV